MCPKLLFGKWSYGIGGPLWCGQNHTLRARTEQWYKECYILCSKLKSPPDDLNGIISSTLNRSWQIRALLNIIIYPSILLFIYPLFHIKYCLYVRTMFEIGATEEQDACLCQGESFLKAGIFDLGFWLEGEPVNPLKGKENCVGFLCTHVHTMSISLGKKVYSFYPLNTGICDSKKVKNHIKL